MARSCFLVKRGMVFWYEPTKSNTKTSVQQGRRPWVVISNDEGNISAPTCNIVPTTTEDKTPIPTHVDTWFNGQKNTILCEQVITVDQNVLKDFVCFLTDDTMNKVSDALSIQYCIRPVVKYMDFNMDNLIQKLESMMEEIIKSKVQSQKQSVSYSSLEDSALKLGQMIEDLVGVSENKTTVVEDNKNDSLHTKVTETSNPNVTKHVENNIKPESNKTDISKNNSRPRQKWTVEMRCQYLRDCDSMSPEDIRLKYGFSTIGTVFSTKYNCRNILNEMGVDYKNETVTSRKASNGD